MVEQESKPRPLESLAFNVRAPSLPEMSVTLANTLSPGAELSSCL